MGNQQDKKVLYYHKKEYVCSLELAMDIIGGKWKPMMIFHLREGAMRSSDLQRTLHGISGKMFTQTIRELEHHRIVERIVYPVVPPKVEYRLTPLGESVVPVVEDMAAWGLRFAEATSEER